MAYKIRRSNERKFFDHGWIQLLSGEISFGPESLQAGDGASFDGTTPIPITAKSAAKLLFFDLK